MSSFPRQFDKEGLLACARGELFGPGNAQLPLPPMLMRTGSPRSRKTAAPTAKAMWWPNWISTPIFGSSPAIFGQPDHARLPGPRRAVAVDRIQPGLARLAGAGLCAGRGEVKLTGMVRPDRKLVRYFVDFTKAVQTRRLTMGVADGRVEADGEVIYLVKDMKVALSEA